MRRPQLITGAVLAAFVLAACAADDERGEPASEPVPETAARGTAPDPTPVPTDEPATVVETTAPRTTADAPPGSSTTAPSTLAPSTTTTLSPKPSLRSGDPTAAIDLVAALSADELLGRDNQTAGSATARVLLFDELATFAQPAVDGDFEIRFETGTNIVAVVPGNELADEYVLLGAHYDHLSIGDGGCPGASSADDICNGAADNATGTAAVVEVARRLAADAPSRSIVVGLWDAEEDGLVGSRAFAADPPIPLDQVVAVVNMDILGSDLLPSLADSTLAIGAETGGLALDQLVVGVGVDSELEVVPLSVAFGQGRSDHAPFVEAGLPAVFFTDSTNGCYHTVDDEFERLNLDKYAAQLDLITEVARVLGSGSVTPTFENGGATVSFGDAIALDSLLSVTTGDLDRFGSTAGDVERAGDVVAAIVADGIAAFDAASVKAILAASTVFVEALTRTPCE